MDRRVVSIFRHPVKGLRGESLACAKLQPGRGIIGDRAFAFQFLDETVPADLRAAPEQDTPWMPKTFLAVQHDWPELARIIPRLSPNGERLRLEIDQGSGLNIEAPLTTSEGRKCLADFVHAFLLQSKAYEKARHSAPAPLRLIGKVDLSSRYTDSNAGPVTIAGVNTFADLGSKLGVTIDPRRFRQNLILSGAEAWVELGWVGRKIRVGQCTLEIQKPLGRCANVDVNPETGSRDAVVYAKLKPTYGHALTGVRADVLELGEIKVGDAWELI